MEGRLTDGDRELVRRARARAPWVLVLGLLLAVLGGVYMVWAVHQLGRAARPDAGFDRSVARLGTLTAPRLHALEAAGAHTERERALLAEARHGADLAARLLVLLMRLLLGSFALSGGLLLLTSGLSERALLRIIAALEAEVGRSGRLGG